MDDRPFPALPVKSYDKEVTSDFETNFKAMIKRIDDYAKDGGQGRSNLIVIFTMILCGTNFFIW